MKKTTLPNLLSPKPEPTDFLLPEELLQLRPQYTGVDKPLEKEQLAAPRTEEKKGLFTKRATPEG